MKTNALLLLCLALVFSACDNVPLPNVTKQSAIGSNFVFSDNDSLAGFKKVLLEDYTGQTCPNCPSAADLIRENLSPRYKDTLVVIAVHQGNTFAKPVGTFTNDFRTSAGEEWGSSAGSGFGIGFYPAGLINRNKYGSNIQNSYPSWSSVIPTALKDPFVVKLNLRSAYDPAVRALNVSVRGKFLQAYSNKTKISLVFIQDGIVGKQKKASTEIEEYDFEHMLRGDINGSWGVDFTTGAVAAGDSIRYVVNDFALPENVKGTSNTGNAPVDHNKVYIVAILYDATTRAVLQAEKVKLLPQ